MKKKFLILIPVLGITMVACKDTKSGDKEKLSVEDTLTNKQVKDLGKNDTSIPDENRLATIDPVKDGFIVAETLKTASFMDYFKAEVDDEGYVTCQFSNIDDEQFGGIFNEENCPSTPIHITNAKGRCRGVFVLNYGGGVDPVLLMLMEDDHVERVSLYALSCGTTKTEYRTTNGGITMLGQGEESDFGGAPIIGYDSEGNEVDLNWEDN